MSLTLSKISSDKKYLTLVICPLEILFTMKITLHWVNILKICLKEQNKSVKELKNLTFPYILIMVQYEKSKLHGSIQHIQGHQVYRIVNN